MARSRRGEGDSDQGDEATRAAAAAAKKHQKHASAWQSAKPKKEKKEKTQFKTYEEIVAESGSALEELLVDLNGQAVSDTSPPFDFNRAAWEWQRADALNLLTAPESIAVLAAGVRCRLCRSDSPPRTPTQPHPPLLDPVLVSPRARKRRRRR